MVISSGQVVTAIRSADLGFLGIVPAARCNISHRSFAQLLSFSF